MTKQTLNEGIYLSLVSQLDKLARHNRQGSFRTKERYYLATKRFCLFLAEAYHLQKLANISGKHLVHYVRYMQEKGYSASTVKTDLAGIRFFHDKISSPKYKLPTNAQLGTELERRRFGVRDRTWSETEFCRMLDKALFCCCDDFFLALCLGRYAGLRIHECFRIDTAIARQAIREGSITVKGKGGKIRTIPLNQTTLGALEMRLERTKPGHKLLVEDDVPTDRAINLLEQFIIKYRPEVQDPDSNRPMTFHGLRHTYAVEKYREFLSQGMSELDAHFAVSRLLGHERADVTNVYLASLNAASDILPPV